MQEIQKTLVQPLGWDHLKEKMTTHFSILVWKIPWTEEPGGLQSMRSQRVDTTEYTNTHILFIWVCVFFMGGGVSLLLFFDSAYKWSHIIFAFVCVTCFTFYSAINFYPWFCQWQYFLFYGWIILCVLVCVHV